jgi:sugar/nucleoside kinase (ribokinase family)
MFLHHAGLNATFGVDDVRWDDVARARVFHLGYPPLMARMIADGGADGGAEMTETFRRAKAAGATTSLDMSLPDAASAAGKIDWRAIMARTLPHVDLFLPSAEEALFLFDRAECAARAGAPDILDTFTGARMTHLSEEALAMGAGVALIKCGHRGAYVRTAGTARLAATLCPPSWANRELWEPAFHVEHVAGATGSGDAAIAGFLASLLRGLELENALTMATAVGACNVMAPDALSGILDWDDTQSKVASAWKKSELTITDTGWRWSEKGNRWHGPADGKPPHKPL